MNDYTMDKSIKKISDEIDTKTMEELDRLSHQIFSATQIPQSMLNNNNNNGVRDNGIKPPNNWKVYSSPVTTGGIVGGAVGTSSNNNLGNGLVYAPYQMKITSNQIISNNQVVYDNTNETTKLSEKNPLIPSIDIFDEVLEDFGGVLQIIKSDYDSIKNMGVIVCLMKDWRIFRFRLAGADFVNITHDEKVTKINHQCQVFEDMDDWCHWEETVGDSEINDKQTLEEKLAQEKESVYGETYKNALNDFFNGNVDSMSDVMKEDII